MNSSPYLFFLSGQLLSWPESFVCSVLLNLTQVFFLYTCFQLPFAKAFILESQYCECLLFPWNSAQFHCTQLTSQGPLKSSLFEMHHQGKQFSHLSWKSSTHFTMRPFENTEGLITWTKMQHSPEFSTQFRNVPHWDCCWVGSSINKVFLVIQWVYLIEESLWCQKSLLCKITFLYPATAHRIL